MVIKSLKMKLENMMMANDWGVLLVEIVAMVYPMMDKVKEKVDSFSIFCLYVYIQYIDVSFWDYVPKTKQMAEGYHLH